MICILMVASSLCMYSLEHEAQPNQFKNAFSGIWWSVSTLLTVGYGDIYPVTTLGKLMAILIAFLGVGLVAIPTGIISAGFVEQYSKLKTIAFHSEERDILVIGAKNFKEEADIHLREIMIKEKNPWVGMQVKELDISRQELIVMIRRKRPAVLAGLINQYQVCQLLFPTKKWCR